MIPQFKCKICKYKWTPRQENPRVCPNCKNKNWNMIKAKKDNDGQGEKK